MPALIFLGGGYCLVYKNKTYKFLLQEEKYNFPYHYLPHFTLRGVPKTTRHLSWGIEYLCYFNWILELIKQNSPSSVLDVGCGDGRLLNSLPSYQTKVGIDLSEKAIKFAQAFDENNECCFQVVNVLDMKKNFDVVVAMEVLEHIPENEIACFIEALCKRTKVGGKLIISVPTKVKPLSEKHYRHYDFELIKSQFDDHIKSFELDIKRVDYVYPYINYMDKFVLRVINKLLNNVLWQIESTILNYLLWKIYYRPTNIKKGRHLIVVFERNA